MAKEDWLGSYAELGNLHTALNNMSRRLRPGNALAGSVCELKREYEGFEADFLAFMPQAVDFVRHEAESLAD